MLIFGALLATFMHARTDGAFSYFHTHGRNLARFSAGAAPLATQPRAAEKDDISACVRVSSNLDIHWDHSSSRFRFQTHACVKSLRAIPLDRNLA